VSATRGQLTFSWLPTLVVLAVVLGAGSRLIYLSAQRHAFLARQAAVNEGGAVASSMTPLLQKLGDLAARQAAAADQAAIRGGAGGVDPEAFANLPAEPHAFWMSGDGAVLYAAQDVAAAAAGIVKEWRSAQPGHKARDPAMLGPLRLGSQWLVAIRVPAGGTIRDEAPRLWSVAYADLEDLIAQSHLARLSGLSYDFELSQVEPRSTRSRIFISSSSAPLIDAIDVRVRQPVPPALAGSYIQVSLRPRDGWYSTTLLASEIALLVFLTWLLAFGTHDLIHALQRSRTLLAGARRRLHSQNQQLAAEMEQRLELMKTVEHASFHDAFTGLPNRRYFMERLDRALRDVRTKSRHAIAVMLVDIVRFKLVNDTLGHTAGDELMVQVARRFDKLTPAFEGVLARWGGDQFALLLLEVASTDATLLLAGALQEQLREPFALRRHRLVVSANFGITCVESGQQRAEDIVRQAAIALSVANRSETARSVLYAPNMAGQAANLVSLEADLHVAMEKHQLRLVFQPIVNLRSRTMVAAETLLRWRHPVEGVIAPDGFLRIAEEAGLMVSITRWIILRVVRTAADWRRRLPADQPFYLSVNLSPAALRDTGLSEFIAALLRETQLAPSLIKFEVTEATLIANVAAARDTLDKLHTLGVQLMLDDFGTGYSSLSYLQMFPFDFVKIDRPFVESAGADRANTGVMAAMVQIAESLHLASIAEIVETEAAAAALQEMGCEYGQGYYFSEPIDAEAAFQRLRSQDPFNVAPPSPSSTLKVRALVEEDSSSTVVMPVGSLRFPPERTE
jgi:diguanylate cyclase (GGDEF)-like protein